MAKQLVEQSNGIVGMTPTAMVEQLGSLYASTIRQGTPIYSVPAVMLWGSPGVGKSQGVRQLASYIQDATGKKVVVTDVRLLLFNPIDLRGIPTADQTRTFAIWLRPKIFDMSPASDVINILFLDEISAAPPSVQAAAYQITLDRVIGEHRLPDNCIVIAAGNRVTDKSVAYRMPKALSNRMCHLQIEVSFDAWKKWALAQKLDPRVVGFLSNRQDELCTFDGGNDDVAYATPRSWEMVSNVLLTGGYSDAKDAHALIAGLVGVGIANEFCSWCRTHAVLPDIRRLLKGEYQKVPSSPDALYATVRMMTVAAGDCSDVTAVRNLVAFSTGFPPDYTASFFKDLIAKGDVVKRRLMQIQEFTRWIGNHASLF
jgi:hypothetical protein